MSITLMALLTVSGGTAPLELPKDVTQALTTARRLAGAAGVPPGQELTLPPFRARLDALILFVDKWSRGDLQSAEVVRLLQGVRDMVDAGAMVTVLPEERLSWIRVGLDLTRALNRSLAERAESGKLPAAIQTQFDELANQLQKQYRDARAKCVSD
jgi:hypothetical protein